MEITNEIKAKVFAQYLGEVLTCHRGSGILEGVSIGAPEMFVITANENSRITEYFENNEDATLFLRPISAITDEDAIEVAKLGQITGVSEDKFALHGRLLLGHYIQRQTNVSGLSWFAILQYLQSKGYDLPHYLLGGKTLKEAGLAIYEVETPA